MKIIEDTQEVMRGPEVGATAGLASLLITAINNEWETVEEYNTLAIMARENGYEDLAKLIDDINSEENNHIGMLQAALKTISPNAEAIEGGEEEATEFIDTDFVDDDVSWFENN